MPKIENELKYVLLLDTDERDYAFDKDSLIEQYYLSSGSRLRLETFSDSTIFFYHTEKYWNAKDCVWVESERQLSEKEFKDVLIGPFSSLLKYRYYKSIGEDDWVVDFFINDTDDTYFVMAEVEMPEGRLEPRNIPKIVADNLLYVVPRDNTTLFSSRKLLSEKYASRLYKELLNG